MIRKHLIKGLAVGVIAGAVSTPGTAFAAETLFAFTVGVDTIPKGQSEIAFGVVRFDGERNAPFSSYTFGSDYERGVGENLSVSFGLGGFYLDFDENAVGAHPGFSGTRLSQVRSNFQRRILSPYISRFGFAVRTEVTVQWYDDKVNDTAAARQFGIRPSFLFQKNYLDDTLVLGANISAKYQHGCLKSDNSADGISICSDQIEFRPSVGASYRFAPRLNFGVESFYRNEFLQEGGSPGGLFAGPSLHYGDRRWYATATLLWQVAGATDYSFPRSVQFLDNVTDLESETEFHFRVGINL